MQQLFSGIKPSGDLHLGNYLGAIKNFVQLQDKCAHALYCVVDMHAITVWQDPADLKRRTYEIIAAYLACGLDPQKSVLFAQSHVPEHAQLAWILNCVARVGWMNRMTQFKDKAGKNKEQASLGLYAYPSLMAADILLYQTTHVPVGDDQKQHVELARDIAQKFNHDFKTDLFVLPEPLMQAEAARIMSLRDGTKKMSKSDQGSDMACLYLLDSADDIVAKIKKAKTDSDALPGDLKDFEGRPEALNLIKIYAALADLPLKKAISENADLNFATFKGKLADLTVSVLDPIGQEMRRLLKHPKEIDALLAQGAHDAQALAAPFLHSVYQTVGFVPRG